VAAFFSDLEGAERFATGFRHGCTPRSGFISSASENQAVFDGCFNQSPPTAETGETYARPACNYQSARALDRISSLAIESLMASAHPVVVDAAPFLIAAVCRILPADRGPTSRSAWLIAFTVVDYWRPVRLLASPPARHAPPRRQRLDASRPLFDLSRLDFPNVQTMALCCCPTPHGDARMFSVVCLRCFQDPLRQVPRAAQDDIALTQSEMRRTAIW